MPLDPQWNEIAREIPDARAIQSKNEKKHRLLGWMEEVFCINCGCSGGMISKDWAAYVAFLCDDCVFKHGALPTTPIPEFFVRDPSTVYLAQGASPISAAPSDGS